MDVDWRYDVNLPIFFSLFYLVPGKLGQTRCCISNFFNKKR